MSAHSITDAVEELCRTLPSHVTLVAAAKTRTPDEVRTAIEGGLTHVGHNYVQEAEKMINSLGRDVKWHLIGHLQRNKAKKAAELFDMVETLDSWRTAQALDRHCGAMGKIMPVLVEINSGLEPAKAGVFPDEADDLAMRLGELRHLRLEGLMTMGPVTDEPEEARPYFRTTRETFERLKTAGIPNADVRWLSMGMSSTYRAAIDEGANMVRIGTKLFGDRA